MHEYRSTIFEQALLSSADQALNPASDTWNLLDKLREAKARAEKSRETTRAGSSYSSSQQDSSDDDEKRGATAERRDGAGETEPMQLSLVLKDDPGNSRTLLLYLKHYSELLFVWGETDLAVQACKLIADACQLLVTYHGHDGVSPDSVMLATNYHNHFDMRIAKRDWLISDFVLFSEYSLSYAHQVELRE